MNENYTEAIREVGTLNHDEIPIIETLTVWHPNTGGISLVNDREPFAGYASTATNSGIIFCEPSNFSLQLPESSKDGTQFMSITFSNVSGEGSKFLEKVPIESPSPIEIVHRIYLGLNNVYPNERVGQIAKPQLDPPLRMQALNVEISPFQISLKASFKSLINAKYPNYKYNLDDFPALSN